MGRHTHRGAAPDVGGWRDRMAVRGGRFVHALASSGWAVVATLGGLLGVLVAVVYMLSPGEHGADNGPAANLVGGVILFVPIGLLVGSLVGLGAQRAARTWLLAPTEAEREAARQDGQHDSGSTAHGLRPDGPWARSYLACLASADAYDAIVETLPGGVNHTWAAEIGERLKAELGEALRLARLGESLAPDGPGRSAGAAGSDTVTRVAGLLHDAERSFSETTDRLAAVALDLRNDSDFARVSAQLDMLVSQAPRLNAPD